MTTPWDEASRCPRDGAFTGKVTQRKPFEGGQLVTLVCPEDNCEYHEMGWVVQLRPDGTIPDKLDVHNREKSFVLSPTAAQTKRRVLEALEEQAAAEQRPGTEVTRF
jgi:hypothetical protein